MGTEFVAALRELARVTDEVHDVGLAWPELPPEGLTSSSRSGGGEIELTNGRVAFLHLPTAQLRTDDDDAFVDSLLGLVNEGLAEHEQFVFACLLEAGGLPGPVSALWEAQAYASSTLMMELDSEEGC